MDIRLVQPALPTTVRATGAGAVKGGDVAALPKPPASDVPAPVQIKDQTADDARRALVEAAAQKLKDIYVVSDVRFTIFKDSGGQYITRFTNLRDGKVSYIPEYDILSNSQAQVSPDAKMLDIDA